MKEWQSPDSGIWEIREPKTFVESTMWCYVALDRAIKMARELGYDEDWRRWEPVSKKIKSHMLSEGWSEKKEAVAMACGGEDLDAAKLLMPLAGSVPARDATMST